MLHNSNLDRSPANRKSKAELRKDLKKWEEEISKKKKIVVRDLLEYQVRYVAFLLGRDVLTHKAIDPAKR